MLSRPKSLYEHRDGVAHKHAEECQPVHRLVRFFIEALKVYQVVVFFLAGLSLNLSQVLLQVHRFDDEGHALTEQHLLLVGMLAHVHDAEVPAALQVNFEDDFLQRLPWVVISKLPGGIEGLGSRCHAEQSLQLGRANPVYVILPWDLVSHVLFEFFDLLQSLASTAEHYHSVFEHLVILLVQSSVVKDLVESVRIGSKSLYLLVADAALLDVVHSRVKESFYSIQPQNQLHDGVPWCIQNFGCYLSVF